MKFKILKNLFSKKKEKKHEDKDKNIFEEDFKSNKSVLEEIIFSKLKNDNLDTKTIKTNYLNDNIAHYQMIKEFVGTLSKEESFFDSEEELKNIENFEEFKKNGNKQATVEIIDNRFLYYHRYEDIQDHWDLKDGRVLEEAYLNTRKTNIDEEISEQENIKREILSNKYKMLRKNYMVLGNGKKTWNKGKKIIGVFIPNSEIINFYFDGMIFISPDVAQKQYGSQDKLDIFDKEKGIVYTSRLYAYIATKNYSDLIIYQYDSNLWAVYAVKNGENIEISKEAFTNDEAHLLIQALLQDMEENTNNQDFNVTGTVHKNSFDKTSLGEDAEVPIGDKTFRIDMSRQYKSSISKGSQNFARTINIRMLETGSALRKITDIGYEPTHLSIILDALFCGEQINTGCIVYAGAPSSGKSTSLFSLFAHLHENYKAQVVTIDSSVEFEHKGFRQISLDDTKRVTSEDRKMTISKVTNNMLKQYANAMMIGEVRDDEQIIDFIKAAERGRLMAATMHTNNVKSIFTVLENTGLKPYQYLPSLRLLVHHTLVPRLCPKCKGAKLLHKFTKTPYTKDMEKNLEPYIQCEECNGIGNSGRALIYEIAYLKPGAVPLDSRPSKDFKELYEKDIINFISKSEIAKMRYDRGEISESVYKSLSLEDSDEMNKKFKDAKKDQDEIQKDNNEII